jgi:hypothetical protein
LSPEGPKAAIRGFFGGKNVDETFLALRPARSFHVRRQNLKSKILNLQSQAAAGAMGS